MGIVGRFTRDKVSAWVWWPFAALLLVLFALTFLGEDRLGDDPSEGADPYPISLVTDATPQEWVGYRITAGVGLGLVFLLALLSLRSSRARIGAGVSFYPESLPPSLTVVDVDEAEQLRVLGTTARHRLGDLQARVTSMETEHLALEGEVQRLLSAAERDVDEPTPSDAVSAGGPGLIVVPEADDVVALHEIERTSELASSPVADEPVAVDAAAPPPDETPADMLARMVDPVGGVDVSEADRVELRARLERTAALKKPGSKERREERERFDDPSESRLP